MPGTQVTRSQVEEQQQQQAAPQWELVKASQGLVWKRLEELRPHLAKAIAGTALHPDRAAHLAFNTFRRSVMTAKPGAMSLADCTVESFTGAVLATLAAGLEIDVDGQAYVVPFRNKNSGTVEATPINGFHGYAHLYWKHPQALALDTGTVYECEWETFEYERGSNAHVRHIPAVRVPVAERGDIVGYYASLTFKNGGTLVDFLDPEQCAAIRGVTVDWKPKVGDPQRWMWRKTPFRQAVKLAPKTVQMWIATQADERPGSELFAEGLHRLAPGKAAPILEPGEPPTAPKDPEPEPSPAAQQQPGRPPLPDPAEPGITDQERDIRRQNWDTWYAERAQDAEMADEYAARMRKDLGEAG